MKSGNARYICATLVQSPSTYALFHIPPRHIHTGLSQLSCFIWCLYCLPPTIFFLLLNRKGSCILSGHSYEAWGSWHQNGFWLEWTISINSLSGEVEPFFYFSYFCLRPACGPEIFAVADENLTWWDGVINFTRMLYEVVRPEFLLAEGRKVSPLGAAGSARLCRFCIHELTWK